jgi:hypothetical protein
MSVQTAAAEYRPVIAGARGRHVLLAYQEGASAATTRLRTSSIDPATLAAVQGELVYTREKDLSVARASQGVWLVWSERQSQGRSLCAMLLPLDAAAVALD